ncbi:anaphase promoting complex subunit 11 [Gregarina niphandrodes]|uniref:Anaphase-promoting complex subunit 11 n=1 Tax=Gregarina niphandrodes TaxID=110365 RepID=A0A023B9M4_GRENI|nr:anaphase promoting complex subunit 11 [Gregarina niphandrodes]EZG73413.1 anaphase promoting complex subunit 11 [Gregarina niphandrodes]|eukprot:XP_011129651.1 anaphase promoting complex subunit 11 [Gregarina niphandrodes]
MLESRILHVSVEAISAIAFWRWETADPTCHICTELQEYPCPTCHTPGEDCPPAVGELCGHAFHLHCFQQWTAKGKNGNERKCPLCRQDFQPAPPAIDHVSLSTPDSQSLDNGYSVILGTRRLTRSPPADSATASSPSSLPRVLRTTLHDELHDPEARVTTLSWDRAPEFFQPVPEETLNALRLAPEPFSPPRDPDPDRAGPEPDP